MQKFSMVAASLVVLAVPTVTQGEDQTSPNQQQATTAPAQTLRNGCQQLYTQRQFRHYASRVYLRKRVIYKSRAQMRTMVRCQHSPKAERKMRKVRKQLKWARVERARLRALTPYGPCFGGYWAVPCEIIGGESKGSWSVVNSRGCIGPYQFCGWNVPWPVRTLRDKIAHHAEASSLWRGGSGCSNWQETSSAC